MKRKYLTVRELLAADPELISKVVSEARKYDTLRVRSQGTIHSVTYDVRTRTLKWSDYEGDPTVRNIGMNDPINFRGDGKWTYALYTEELVYS